MMQRLKNYRERLARLQQMREKELSDVVERPKNRERLLDTANGREGA